MDVSPKLPIPSNKRIFLQIQNTRRLKNGLEFSSLPLQGKVPSRGAKLMKYLPQVKSTEKS
jgi:hypothetical protein